MSTPVIPTLAKTPQEIRYFSFDLSAKAEIIAGDPLISGGVAVTYSGSDSTLVISNISVASPLVIFRVAGGTSGLTYELECACYTASGSIVGADGFMVIYGI